MAVPARIQPQHQPRSSRDRRPLARRRPHDMGRREVESEHALRAWFKGAASRRAAAYLAHRAAVDREEAAARDLQRLCELTQPYQEQLAHTQ
jgi:hypothetical protein